MDRQEQYSRRNCILIHGLKDEKNESTDDRVMKLFREELYEDVLLVDFDRTHRIREKRDANSKPRPVIEKFAQYNIREKFFKSKEMTQGKKCQHYRKSYLVTRMSVLNEAIEKFGFKNAWTYDRRILCKGNNDGQKIKIYYE